MTIHSIFYNSNNFLILTGITLICKTIKKIVEDLQRLKKYKQEQECTEALTTSAAIYYDDNQTNQKDSLVVWKTHHPAFRQSSPSDINLRFLFKSEAVFGDVKISLLLCCYWCLVCASCIFICFFEYLHVAHKSCL